MPTGIFPRKPMTEETKRKIGLTHKGKKLSEEHRKKLSIAHTGVKLSFFHRKRQSEGRVGEKHWNWKGGKVFDKIGYIYIHSPNHPFCNNHKLVFEHRLVMEKHLGRYLHHQEIVHHINRDKSDNRIENLMLFANNYEHLHFHNSHIKGSQS